MPKIDKKSVKKFPNCDTLRIFKYENSKMFHCSFYVSESYSKNHMFSKSLKTSNYKDATILAKKLYKEFDKDAVVKQVSEIDFDRDIAKPYFAMRLKKYLSKNTPQYAEKEKNRYEKFMKPFFENIDYRNQDALETAIEEVVYELRKNNIKDTTISKYINTLSLMFQKSFKSRKIEILPDLPTMKRINEERPMYFPREMKLIINAFKEEYRNTEDPFYDETADYISLCRSSPIRPGLEPLRIKRFQCSLLNDSEYPFPKLKIFLKTKTKERHLLPVHPEFTNQVYIPRMMPRYSNMNADEYLFYPNEINRNKLYERIRKNFRRISTNLNLYYFNEKERPLYSIRHMFITQRYNKDIPIDVIADTASTSVDVVKSNYLEYDDTTFLKQEKRLFKDYYDRLSSAKVVQKSCKE